MWDIEKLRAVFDGSREPAVYLADGIVEYQNPAAAELLPAGLPETLRASLAAAEPFPVLLEGRLVLPAAVEGDGGTLVLLRPADGGGLERRLPLLVAELRSQLNNLMAAIHLVGLEEGRSDGPERDYTAIMNQSLYSLLRLTQNAQLAQDMSRGEVSFHPRPLDLAGFCKGLCDQVEGLAALAGQSFSYESGTDSLLTVGDEDLLRRLLLELVGNALRAAGRGGKAGVRLAAAGKRAVLTVWNNGEGADLAGLDAPDFTPKPTGGLRLGLPAARYIAALHGGAVMVESKAEEGTRVTVSLPVCKPGAEVVHSPAGDATGGFSPVLVALSGVLPYSAYRSQDIDD